MVYLFSYSKAVCQAGWLYLQTLGEQLQPYANVMLLGDVIRGYALESLRDIGGAPAAHAAHIGRAMECGF